MSNFKQIDRKISTVYNSIKNAPRDVLRLFVAVIDHANEHGDKRLFQRLIEQAPNKKYAKRLAELNAALGITIAKDGDKVTITGMGRGIAMHPDYAKVQELAKTDATLFGAELAKVVPLPEPKAKEKAAPAETAETPAETVEMEAADMPETAEQAASDVIALLLAGFGALNHAEQAEALRQLHDMHRATGAAETAAWIESGQTIEPVKVPA